jgi:hypothetical protein
MEGCRSVVVGGLVLVGTMALARCNASESYEAGATSTLRGIVVGQVTYSAICGNGFYAPTLETLAKPKPGEQSGFILDTDLPRPGTTVLEKYRYRIEMTAPASPDSPAGCSGVPAGQSAKTFSITARPDGIRAKSFRIDHEGNLTEIQ